MKRRLSKRKPTLDEEMAPCRDDAERDDHGRGACRRMHRPEENHQRPRERERHGNGEQALKVHRAGHGGWWVLKPEQPE